MVAFHTINVHVPGQARKAQPKDAIYPRLKAPCTSIQLGAWASTPAAQRAPPARNKFIHLRSVVAGNQSNHLRHSPPVTVSCFISTASIIAISYPFREEEKKRKKKPHPPPRTSVIRRLSGRTSLMCVCEGKGNCFMGNRGKRAPPDRRNVPNTMQCRSKKTD